MRAIVVIATWLAMMVWIGPPQHLRPFVRQAESVYVMWQHATEGATHVEKRRQLDRLGGGSNFSRVGSPSGNRIP